MALRNTASFLGLCITVASFGRIIRIGDGPRLPAEIRPWLGDSWGRWEGDVLVVETTNIHPLQRYSSEEMKVTERFSRVDEETVLYQFTIDDPTTYTEPWGGSVVLSNSLTLLGIFFGDM